MTCVQASKKWYLNFLAILTVQCTFFIDLKWKKKKHSVQLNIKVQFFFILYI